MLKTTEKLGEILLKIRLVSEEQLAKALDVQRGTTRRIGEVLVELGLTTELDIASALSEQLGIPYASEESGLLTPRKGEGLEELVPEEFARERLVLPLARTGRVLKVVKGLPGTVIDDLASRHSERLGQLHLKARDRFRPGAFLVEDGADSRKVVGFVGIGHGGLRIARAEGGGEGAVVLPKRPLGDHIEGRAEPRPQLMNADAVDSRFGAGGVIRSAPLLIDGAERLSRDQRSLVSRSNGRWHRNTLLG